MNPTGVMQPSAVTAPPHASQRGNARTRNASTDAAPIIAASAIGTPDPTRLADRSNSPVAVSGAIPPIAPARWAAVIVAPYAAITMTAAATPPPNDTAARRPRPPSTRRR